MKTSKRNALATMLREKSISNASVASTLGYNRATVRHRLNDPTSFTIQEVIALSGLLKKTPTAIVKIVLKLPMNCRS
jgi:hypothetical protein